MIIREETKYYFKSPDDIARVMRDILLMEDIVDREKEHQWVIGLNGKLRVQYIDLVSLGIVNEILIHPRETYRLAVMKGVTDIIVVHNHPSGETDPSGDDMDITRRLKESGDILGIELLDHLIINSNGDYYSFSEAGIIMG
jgi:DNA repair protein RadC